MQNMLHSKKMKQVSYWEENEAKPKTCPINTIVKCLRIQHTTKDWWAVQYTLQSPNLTLFILRQRLLKANQLPYIATKLSYTL